jgi:hypothetical protein
MHPATEAILRHFSYNHLPPDLRAVSKQFADIAFAMAASLPADPETTVCLRKLVEGKDAAVRAAIVGRDGGETASDPQRIRVTFTWSNGDQVVVHEPLADWFDWHEDGILPPVGVFPANDPAVVGFGEYAGQSDFHPLQGMDAYNDEALTTIAIELVA